MGSARSASATPHVVEAAAVRELQAELLYPPGTPKRSNKVLVELRTHVVAMPSEFELDLLLSRPHAHDDWNRALRSMTVPSEQRCVLCHLARRRKPSGGWRRSGRASQGRT